MTLVKNVRVTIMPPLKGVVINLGSIARKRQPLSVDFISYLEAV
jgi:hypothetical protein